LRDLIALADADVVEKTRRERLVRDLDSSDKAHPLELARVSWSELKRLLQRWKSNNGVADSCAIGKSKVSEAPARV